jgi:hypothetical protein
MSCCECRGGLERLDNARKGSGLGASAAEGREARTRNIPIGPFSQPNNAVKVVGHDNECVQFNVAEAAG